MDDKDSALFDEERRLDERDRLRSQRDEADLKAVLASPAGRRFVWGVLAQCGVFTSSYTEQPLGMAFSEGRRSIGLALVARIMARTPDLFLTMQKENIDDGHSSADA